MISLVVAVIIMAFIISLRLFSEELSTADLKYEAGTAMERMIKELRGAKEIVSAEAALVSFWWKDLNENLSREADETVAFSWDGTPGNPLFRSIGTDSVKINNHVHYLLFSYVIPSDIEIINISLTVLEGQNIYTSESSVKLRNL